MNLWQMPCKMSNKINHLINKYSKILIYIYTNYTQLIHDFTCLFICLLTRLRKRIRLDFVGGDPDVLTNVMSDFYISAAAGMVFVVKITVQHFCVPY